MYHVCVASYINQQDDKKSNNFEVRKDWLRDHVVDSACPSVSLFCVQTTLSVCEMSGSSGEVHWLISPVQIVLLASVFLVLFTYQCKCEVVVVNLTGLSPADD